MQMSQVLSGGELRLLAGLVDEGLEPLEGSARHGKRGQIYFLSAIGDTYVTVSVKEGQAMPRKARIVIPGVAHHVVQRGHNRQVVFAADEDFSSTSRISRS